MNSFKICFISGKLGDVDGVSLEVDKWIEVLLQMGHDIYAIAGSYGTPLKNVKSDNCIVLDKIRFDSPQQKYFEKLVFPHLSKHPPHLSSERKNVILDELEEAGSEISTLIYEFIQEKEIDVLVGQNTNAMPMSLLAGIAVHKLAVEKRMAVIFHHHDFWWERSRFSHNHIEGFLKQIMPPTDLGTEHIVISSYAAHILRSIKRVNPIVIHNCEDFDNPPVIDDYNTHFRKDLGFKDDDILIVQPTRVVPRKRIEDSVELIAKYIKKYKKNADKVHFIISLYEGDETEHDYVAEIQKLAQKRGVSLHFIAHRVESNRRIDDKYGRIYTNRDILVNADIVTFLPLWEGFGNALLETVAARVPLIITTYLVYKTDIKMCGFRNIEVRDVYDASGKLVIEEKNIDDMHSILTDNKLTEEIVNHNYQIGAKEFSFHVLKNRLKSVLDEYGDEIRASRKRIQKSKHDYYV